MHTCLVVDDSPVIRKISRRILEDLGFEVAEACDGMEALAWCNAVMPDLIVLDWRMPEMDGLAFLRRLRHEPGGAVPKVVLCSSETTIARVSEALSAGADEYLMKPFDSDLMASRLAHVGFAA